jgi:hypothetical protein
MRYEVNKPDVVDESVDGEALIVHLGTGAYYSARGDGDIAWQLLSMGATAAEIASHTGSDAAAIEAFAAQLLDEGLVRARTRDPEPLTAAAAITAAPVLEKYTDMQELLLLDPIHDVEEAGWPKARPAAGG